ncbi:MAG TPA: Rieske 2Fe-2S domain-containing protein [Candidatus Baltobacteraceae bacterium]|jgi:Rieske Fe-S protein|nr:Rieske 2Fe-2S domain-containing protein [Candidatus Baltobacteraceae bacterium]
MSEPNQEPEIPAPSQAPQKKVSRRNMLMTLGIALNAVAGILFAVPVIGYILGPAKRSEITEDLAWITLGPLTQFPEGQTRLATYRNPLVRPWDGDTADIPCWVRRISADKLQVFAINCTHLGCPVRWFPQSGLFMCPCHGGVYYSDGARASGPPPRGLFEYSYKIEQGNLWIKAGQVPTLASPPSQASAAQPRGCPCA